MVLNVIFALRLLARDDGYELLFIKTTKMSESIANCESKGLEKILNNELFFFKKIP